MELRQMIFEALNATENMIITDSDTGAEYDYTNIAPEDLCFGLTFLILGIILQCFTIFYERFKMDPMKRGLINQVCMHIFTFKYENKVEFL